MQNNSENSRSRVEELEQELERFRTFEKNLASLLSQDPAMMEFLADWADGESPVVGLIRRHGDELREALENPELQEKIASAHLDRLKQLQEEKDLEAIYDKNLAASLTNAEEFCKEASLPEAEMKKFLEAVITIVREGLEGTISSETMRLVRRAANYERDVENARQEGELKGRNAKIEELMQDPPKDRMPNLSGSAMVRTGPERQSIFALARNA